MNTIVQHMTYCIYISEMNFLMQFAISSCVFTKEK